MKALVFSRDLPRFGAAKVAGSLRPGLGAAVGPLELDDIDVPTPPADAWLRLRPRLSGICGSDLSTIDGHASTYFESVVSFPFVPGHEVVADTDDGRRVVLEPVLGCAARGRRPSCDACADDHRGSCQHLDGGAVSAGLQTGYCADTGGGWGIALVAHESQVHDVPEAFSDEDAVMVEPTACAVHAALAAAAAGAAGGSVAVLGAGTLGLTTIAALRAHAGPTSLLATAKYPHQKRWATELGADTVVEPGEVTRAVRRAVGARMVGSHLSAGVDVTVDCVGSPESLADALAVTKPRGTVVMVGMAGVTTLDLTPLWHREIRLAGAYAYGTEANGARTFDLAVALVADRQLGRLVSATYPLHRYRDAIAHAADAGRRGAVKIAFDLRGERERNRL